MKRSDFEFELPEALIAQYPLKKRTASKLLVLDTSSGQCFDQQFSDLVDVLHTGDLLIFNDTKVIPARIFGHKASGGKVELLFERLQSDSLFLAHIKSSKAPKAGTTIIINEDISLQVRGREDDLFICEFNSERPPFDILQEVGHIPLPPYIQREDEGSDTTRYQTVFAKHRGAVAAPTAGLHFDEAFIQTLKQKGVDIAFVTLHVGAGTFQPVRVDDIANHKMHAEMIDVSDAVVQKIKATHSQGKRVIAVGTTVVRSLEAAALGGELTAYQGDTEIFITPGFKFKVIDGLVTNFHLPGSTLIMLVSAFAGYEHTLAAYRHAVKQEYRFFSYGDAMFLGDLTS